MESISWTDRVKYEDLLESYRGKGIFYIQYTEGRLMELDTA
jgi:hypothetical protein